jgi:hypothetical protein
MTKVDFPKFFNGLLSGVKDIAKDNLKEYLDAAIKDGEQVLNDLEENLSLWTQQVATGELSRDDFEYTLLSEKELLTLVALKRAGLTEVQADKFKNAIFDLILQTVSTIIP